MNPALLLDRQLCFALYSASRALTQTYGPLLAPLGLTYPQYLVMLVLWEADGRRVSELGERLSLDSGTLTPLLKRLEKAKLVVRRRDAGDERVVRVSLTAAGRKLEKRAAGVPTALLCSTGLGLADLGALRDELRGLRDRLESARTEQPAPRRATR